MGLIYLVMYLLIGLTWLVYLGLALGVPLLILWRLRKAWAQPIKRVLWIAAGVVWCLPAGVELVRDVQLAAWVRSLPTAEMQWYHEGLHEPVTQARYASDVGPVPFIELQHGQAIALEDGVFDAKTGQAIFAACLENRWGAPLCPFQLGPAVQIEGQTIATGDGETWQAHIWARSDNCNLHWRNNSIPENIQAYFTVQGICAQTQALPAGSEGLQLRYETGRVPGTLVTPFGQIVVQDLATGVEQARLTAFRVERPLFPALWGMHWLPVLEGITPDRTVELHYGVTYDEAAMTGFPVGSLQDIVFSAGWGGSYWGGTKAEANAILEAQFGYDADRALPALRSDAFFPVRFALETVCTPQFRDRVTAEMRAEVERIAQMEGGFSNSLPNELARKAIAEGCGADVAR